jgi:hypothetical protein
MENDLRSVFTPYASHGDFWLSIKLVWDGTLR